MAQEASKQVTVRPGPRSERGFACISTDTLQNQGWGCQARSVASHMVPRVVCSDPICNGERIGFTILHKRVNVRNHNLETGMHIRSLMELPAVSY